jgi:hypothetical protein
MTSGTDTTETNEREQLDSGANRCHDRIPVQNNKPERCSQMNSEAGLSRRVNFVVGMLVLTAVYAAMVLAVKYFLP